MTFNEIDQKADQRLEPVLHSHTSDWKKLLLKKV